MAQVKTEAPCSILTAGLGEAPDISTVVRYLVALDNLWTFAMLVGDENLPALTRRRHWPERLPLAHDRHKRQCAAEGLRALLKRWLRRWGGNIPRPNPRPP